MSASSRRCTSPPRTSARRSGPVHSRLFSGATGGYYAERMVQFVELLTDPPATTMYEVAVREP